jgi:RNA polymerase sigma-70 factor, ECF subfamily
MTQYSEAEVISKAMAGDAQAFRLLVENHQRFAYSLAFKFLGNRGDAEDATQEAFIRLWKHIAVYRREIKLTTWLYKIVTNVCLDQLKSAYRKRSKNFEAVDESIEDRTGSDGEMITRELQQAILEMAQTLTPKQKAVFVLRDLEDLSVDEVSSVLNMASWNIKSNLYQARVKMAGLLREYYREKKVKLP